MTEFGLLACTFSLCIVVLYIDIDCYLEVEGVKNLKGVFALNISGKKAKGINFLNAWIFSTYKLC